MKVDPAEALPSELFQEILSYLDADDVANSTRVNISWNQLGTDGVLWQSLCRVRWQGKRYMRRVFKIGIPHILNSNSGKQLWQSSPEKWKWAYGQVELESQRTATTESEIVESYWKFTVHILICS
jgi:hypothetical protein